MSLSFMWTRGLIHSSRDGDHSRICTQKTFCLFISCGHDNICGRANNPVETPVVRFPGIDEENSSKNGREGYDDPKSQIQIRGLGSDFLFSDVH